MKRPVYRVSPRVCGFTLLEVLVALTLIGLGFGVALSGITGSLDLAKRASEHENAVLLAKARMAEAANYPDYDLLDDVESETYSGVEYSYRIEFSPITLVDKRLAEKVKLPFRLEEIRVTVYWSEGSRQSYTLSTFKMIPEEPPPPPATQDPNADNAQQQQDPQQGQQSMQGVPR